MDRHIKAHVRLEQRLRDLQVIAKKSLGQNFLISDSVIDKIIIAALSFKNNNSFGVLVFFPFLIYGVTEVFLGRYQGVIFFALLHQVFINRLIIPKLEFDLKSN